MFLHSFKYCRCIDMCLSKECQCRFNLLAHNGNRIRFKLVSWTCTFQAAKFISMSELELHYSINGNLTVKCITRLYFDVENDLFYFNLALTQRFLDKLFEIKTVASLCVEPYHTTRKTLAVFGVPL